MIYSKRGKVKFCDEKEAEMRGKHKNHLKVRESNIILKLKFPNFLRLGFFSICYHKT